MVIGPTPLLGHIENHIPMAPPVHPTPIGAPGVQGELLLSSPGHVADLAGLALPAESQKQVFVRYDKEEPEDIEISLESDSDDSVVIMPQGMLLEIQEGATNVQNLPPQPGGTVPGSAAGLGGEVGTAETALPNDLPATILPVDPSSLTSFSGSGQAEQMVTLVPPLNTNAVPLTVPSGNLGNSLPAGAQLQQMLMQPSPGGQTGQLGLSLHMKFPNQLAHGTRQPSSNEHDQNIININSSDEEEEEDEEDEEEDMDEDELGEEEEEEEGLDEEDEEEDGSDDPEGYYQERFEGFEEDEAEELEDEEEEEEVIQAIEGENQRPMIVAEEGEVMIEGQEDSGIGAFSVEGERPMEAGIEEMQAVRNLYGEEGIQDKATVEEIENIGAVERNESETGELQIETHVIGSETEQTDDAAPAPAADQEVCPHEQEESKPVPTVIPQDSRIISDSQETSMDVRTTEQSTEAEKEEMPSTSTAPTSDNLASQQTAEKEETEQEESQVTEAEARGKKRKIGDLEDVQECDQNSEKKVNHGISHPLLVHYYHVF